MEGGGVSGCVECVGTVDEGCAQGDGRAVLDLEVQACWGGENPVVCRSVGDCVADYFADFDAACLVEEQHVGGCDVWMPRLAKDADASTWVICSVERLSGLS